MGAEQSTLSPADEEQHAKFVDAEIAKYAQEEMQKPLDKRRKKKSAAEQAAAQERPSAAEDLDSGEMSEASAEGDLTVPIRSANSSQSTPLANDLLERFKPRKEKEFRKKSTDEQPSREKEPKDSSVEQPREDEFLGFGNEASKQGAIDHPTKKRPRLETGSDSIKVAAKFSHANSPKSPNSAKIPSTTLATTSSKRPAPEERPSDARRPSLSALQSLPKIPKRSSVASPESPDRAEGDQLSAVGDERPPKWYNNTTVPLRINKNDAQIDALLSSLRYQIEKPKRGLVRPDELPKVLTEVRHKLHAIIFQLVNPQVLKKYRMLHNDGALAQIFDPEYSNGVDWPFDIRADAKELYYKWCRKVFETDILRGIKFSLSVKGTKKEGGDSIDRDYKGVVSANYHGPGELINGQWWPFQICALRDGAHGVIQGGIFGAKDKGAYSCILSGGNDSAGKPYPDEDYGDEVLYCGTDSDNGEVTAYTQRMLESVGNEPVRLIRSHNLHSDYAPKYGFRYDGLYHVADFERMDPENSIRQRHRFRLIRQRGQDPIRGSSGPEKRPTPQEIEQYLKHQKLSGKGGGKGSS